MSQESIKVSSIEACHYVWDILWNPQQEDYASTDILDLLIFNEAGFGKWLFTTKDGIIKNKTSKKRNKEEVLALVTTYFGQYHSFNIDYFATQTSKWTKVTSDQELIELLNSKPSNPIPMILNTRSMITLASTTNNSQYLMVQYINDTYLKHNVTHPKFKYYYLMTSKAMGKKVQSEFPSWHHSHSNKPDKHFPSELLVCRQSQLQQQSKDFISNLVKVIESARRIKILLFSIVTYVEDIQTGMQPLNDVGSVIPYRIWLHHIEDIEYVSTNNLSSNSMQSNDMLSQSRMAGSTLSKSTYLHSLANSIFKPGSCCCGDFCYYDQQNSEQDSHQDLEVDVELEEFDIKVESQRAIQRHKPLARNDSFNSIDDELKPSTTPSEQLFDEENQDSNLSNSPMEDNSEPSLTSKRFSQENSSTNSLKSNKSLLPVKSFKILVKNIINTREEIQKIIAIDREYNALLPRDQSIEKMNEMRAQIAEIWPLPLAKWWLHHGQLNPKFNNFGKFINKQDPSSSSPSKSPNEEVIIKPSPLKITSVDEENSKWFSSFYLPLEVCETCYYVYQQLESFRTKHRKQFRRLLKVTKEENLSEDERKQRNRDIERRIFNQRKFVSKMSRSKSVPEDLLRKQQVQYNSNNRRNIPAISRRNGNKLLPPLPWNLHDHEEQNAYIDQYVNKTATKRVLNSLPDYGSTSMLPTDEDSIFEKWNDVTQPRQPEIIPMRRPPSKSVSNKININGDYNHERLLHPWQRDLENLKKQLPLDITAEELRNKTLLDLPLKKPLALDPLSKRAQGIAIQIDTSTLDTPNVILSSTSQSNYHNNNKSSSEKLISLQKSELSEPFLLKKQYSWKEPIPEHPDEHHYQPTNGDDDDDDDEDNIMLGWNPFTLNLDGSVQMNSNPNTSSKSSPVKNTNKR